MPTTAFDTYELAGNRLDPVYNSEDAEQQNVALADGTYAAGTVLGEKVGASQVDTLTLSCTGGTITIVVPATAIGAGGTTTAITCSASLPTAATLQAALAAVPGVGADNVTVTGSAGGPFTINFVNDLADEASLGLTIGTNSLTGGSGTAVFAVVTAGSTGTLGTFAPYISTNTDGTQHARCILRYACVVASGVITGITSQARPTNAVPAFMRGYFRTDQVVGLDSQALTDLGATIVQGTFDLGVVRVG